MVEFIKFDAERKVFVVPGLLPENIIPLEDIIYVGAAIVSNYVRPGMLSGDPILDVAGLMFKARTAALKFSADYVLLGPQDYCKLSEHQGGETGLVQAVASMYVKRTS